MSDLTDPAAVSAEEFTNAKELIISILGDRDPDIDLSDGSALVGLVVENEAYMGAIHGANYDTLNKSFSLQAIADNIVDVDDTFVDSLVSNYFITRREASPASGPVRIIVNLDVVYVIPAGFTFTAGTTTYETEEPIRVLRSGSQADQTSNQRVLTPRADGRFEFTITVVATTEGSDGQISAGTALTIISPVDGMETASAATDFTGGEDRETNAELLARAQEGITAKTLAGPEHIQATLQDLFPGIKTTTLGIGNALMTRDRGNVFGISTGATEDIWVKTTAFPQTTTITVTAAATTDGAATFAFTLSGATAAGIYRVRFIRPADLAGVQGVVPDSVTPIKRTDIIFSPKTPSQDDLFYGAIANLRVVFTDDQLTDDEIAAVVSGDTRDYEVEVLKMPSVDAVSNYVYDPSVRPVGTDYCVRGGVPAVLNIDLEIQLPSGVVAPVVQDVQEAVAAAINALDFGTERVGVYTVHKAVAALLPEGEVAGVAMLATIYAPNQDEFVIPATNYITIPTDLTRGFSPANTFLTCPPDNVGVTIVSE